MKEQSNQKRVEVEEKEGKEVVLVAVGKTYPEEQ